MFALESALAFALGFLVICYGLLRWNELRYRKKGIPPGTMGWPLFGETTEFLKQGPNFLKNQKARYGSLFKSHILGFPTVVCMDPDINRYILMNESKGLVPGYPQSMLDILGECNIAAVTGPLHKSIRSAMLGLINPPMIRSHLLSKIDEFMRSHLSHWNDQVIDIQEKTKEMALYSALKQIAGIESGPVSEALKAEIFQLVLGTLSLPINLPGTNYRRAFRVYFIFLKAYLSLIIFLKNSLFLTQARRKVVEMFRAIIEERRSSHCFQNDLLDFLLKSDENMKTRLTDEQITDLIIALVYSGYETVSTTSMMAVKYLHDHPKALHELRKENLNIRKGKSSEEGIDWDDYKSMAFTRAVILETLRMATVVNGVMRKTTRDIEMKGFVIPQGWRIYVCTRELNYDPNLYHDPLNFNPWRWLDRNLDSHQNFMMFGGGSRLCPGKELGTAEIATFLHHLVTRYRWKEVGGATILEFPRVQALNGLHIRFSSYRVHSEREC